MKAKISELMDGELEGPEAGRLASALREEGEDREAWRLYHLIGDTLRDTGALSPGFAGRLQQRLAAEPTVLAPVVRADTGGSRRWSFLMPLAAGAAAAAMVGWMAFGPSLQDGSSRSVAPVATAPVAQPTPAAVGAEAAAVPPPVGTEDYLLAHQNYSSRSLVQVVPYVRTVSGRAAEYKR